MDRLGEERDIESFEQLDETVLAQYAKPLRRRVACKAEGAGRPVDENEVGAFRDVRRREVRRLTTGNNRK